MFDGYYRAILDQSPDGVLVESRDRVVYLNDVYARILGYHGQFDLRDATVRDIAHAEDQDRLTFYSRCREGRRPAPPRYQFRACARDHSVLQLDASVSTARIGSDLLIVTFVRLSAVADDAVPPAMNALEYLSVREREVLQLLAVGKRNKEIALQLGISEKTVSAHRVHVNRKLAFRNDLDLFRFASENGLLTTS